jgi:hypothetical protein
VPALRRAYELRAVPHAVKSAIFRLSREAMESSLIHGLKAFGRDAECVDVAADIMSLPARSAAARAYIVMFSIVDWRNVKKIAQLEEIELVRCDVCCPLL